MSMHNVRVVVLPRQRHAWTKLKHIHGLLFISFLSLIWNLAGLDWSCVVVKTTMKVAKQTWNPESCLTD